MESETAAEPDGWDRIFATLHSRYPSASQGILFCVHKLQQDQELRLADFRDEAKLHGISLGGRSVHSAKVLMGLEKPSGRHIKKEQKAPEPKRQATRRNAPKSHNSAVEDTLIEAVKQIQDAASSEARELREAIKQAVEILQRAL